MSFCGRRSNLPKVECDFPWHSQHVVKFWEVAGAGNVAFFNTKSSPRSGVRSPKRRARADDFLFGLSSDYTRFMLRSWSNRLFSGGIPSEISRSNLELRISWQAQYLVSSKGGFTCSAHCR